MTNETRSSAQADSAAPHREAEASGAREETKREGRCPDQSRVPGWVCILPAGHRGDHVMSVERRPAVMAAAARCEKCSVTVVNPTTGLIAGDCAFCGGRMVAVKSAAQTCGCGRPMFQHDPVNRPDMWACVMWGCSFRHVPPSLAAGPTPPEADRALREALRTIRDDFDHDASAHRYGTTCRVCLAVVALDEAGRFREPWDDLARAALAPRPTPEDRTDG